MTEDSSGIHTAHTKARELRVPTSCFNKDNVMVGTCFLVNLIDLHLSPDKRKEMSGVSTKIPFVQARCLYKRMSAFLCGTSQTLDTGRQFSDTCATSQGE